MQSQLLDDLIIALALVGFSVEFEDSHPALSMRAWETDIYRTERWGLRPIDALALL